MKTKITFMLMAFAIMMGLQSCGGDPKLTVNANDFDFKSTHWPAYITTTRSAISVTRPMSWVISRMAMFSSSRSRRKSCMICS